VNFLNVLNGLNQGPRIRSDSSNHLSRSNRYEA
jgi:hypothetical protein